MNETEKRKAAIAAMNAYKDHAASRWQEIADEAAWMLEKFGADPSIYPATAKFLALRNKADDLRKEVLP